jgi:hypothetical protein
VSVLPYSITSGAEDGSLNAGVDRDVLDVDLRAFVGLLESGDDGVDDLLLGGVADLLEEPHAQRAGLLVLVGGGVRGGLGRTGSGQESGERGEPGTTDGQLHGVLLRDSVATCAMKASLCTTLGG